jgi:hypothetical protein
MAIILQFMKIFNCVNLAMVIYTKKKKLILVYQFYNLNCLSPCAIKNKLIGHYHGLIQ